MSISRISISKSELAQALGISRQTLYRKLKELGIRSNGSMLTPNELKTIDEFIGIPDGLITKKKG